MNNLRLLAGCALSVLLSGGACAYTQSVVTLEEIYQCAEANSVRLRPLLAAEAEADKEISVAKSSRLPDIDATLSVSYIGDGITTKRNFSDYQNAPIPHLGTGMSVGVYQPLYTGGAITSAIDIAELKSTAARFDTDLHRKSDELAERNYNTVATRYSEGMALITDLLEAADSRLSAQQQLVDARIDIIYYYPRHYRRRRHAP